MTKNKIEELHYLRALAFLAVVLQHTIAHYAYTPDAALADGVAFALLLLLSKFAVPLFVFITGLVLFYNYDGYFRYGSFLHKRFKDIVIPYLFWTVVFGAVSVFENNHALTLSEWLRMALTGKASYHLWYIIMILQFYLLFPLYRYAVNLMQRWIHTAKHIYIALPVIAALYIILMMLIGPVQIAAERWNIPVVTPMLSEYADRNALYFVYYFLLGAATSFTLTRFRQWLDRHRVVIHVSFSIMFCYLAFRVISSFELTPAFRIHYDDLLLLRPVMAVYLILSVLVLYRLGIRLSETAGTLGRKLLMAIGHYSYGAYLMHALALYAATFIADMLLAGMNVTLRAALAFILCAAMSILATYWLSKLPIIGKIATGLGKPRKKARHSASYSSPKSVKGSINA